MLFVQQLYPTVKFPQDIRKHLVDPLPRDCRLTVRLLVPLSLSWNLSLHYRPSLTPVIQVCSSTWSITIATTSDAGALNVCPSIYFTLHPSHPPDLQAVSEREKKPPIPYNAGKRRHSDAALRPWVMRNNPHLRSAFKRAATITRVVVRLKSLVANKRKSARNAAPNAYGPTTPRGRCGSCFCIYELLSSPLVV